MLLLKTRLTSQRLRRPLSVARRLVVTARVQTYRHLGVPSIPPTFLIAGAQKAGTTSLLAYLCRHPAVLPPLTKEIHYFDLRAQEPLDWYLAHFPWARARHGVSLPITGEASPYYLFHPLAPARVARLFPQMKIIILLREPVSRALSHYWQEVMLAREQLPLMDALLAEEKRLAGEEQRLLAEPTYRSDKHQHYSYFARGLYLKQIERWQANFPPRQLLVLDSTRLRQDAEQVYHEVLEFLGLRSHALGPAVEYNRGARTPDHPEARAWLRDRYRGPNQRLFEYLGVAFDW
jgi:hypothetical protein